MTPVQQWLIGTLERTNYVRPSTDAEVECCKAMGMSLYAPEAYRSGSRGVWVPDVGTYDRIVEQKYGYRTPLLR